MTEKYILAHDLGTTGNKATLFDSQGKVRASYFRGYSTDYLKPNWVEQNPEDWWQAVCESTHQLMDAAKIKAEEIACVSLCGHMMGCVAVDRQGNPLRTAIIYSDTRAVNESQKLIDKVGMEPAYRITGHRTNPSLSGEKMMWVHEHQPDIYKETYKFLQAKDFIATRLTGKFVTDYSDASGTDLYDLVGYQWSSSMVEASGLDPEKLPELHASIDVIGEVTHQSAEAVGLKAGTAVVIGSGDGACAATGAGVVREGSAYNYLGASAWIGVATSQPVFDPAMRTFTLAHLVPGLFTASGPMISAGGAYQWVRDQLCQSEKKSAAELGVSPYELMNLQVLNSNPGANGLIFLPYLLGERSPRWNPEARAVFFGLSMSHTRADMIRATLEGITYNLRVILEALQKQGVTIPSMRVIGGGANGAVWRQILADIYGMPIQRPELVAEATSFGAALAGGIGVGIYPDVYLAEKLTPIVDTTLPNPKNKAIYDRMYSLFNRAYDAFVPLYSELANIIQ
jgi:xylulokinase